jgi:cell division protein FtsN
MDPSESSQQPGGGSKGDPASQKPPAVDVKPRLTKEQHDVLEQHFQVQHKPSTLVKKDFASKLGVPLDKINVRRLAPAACALLLT